MLKFGFKVRALTLVLLLTTCAHPSYAQKCPYQSEHSCDLYYSQVQKDECARSYVGRECRIYTKIQEDRALAKQEKRCYGHEWCKYH
jgi:hypothetical protein